MVRLLQRPLAGLSLREFVSIPQWCDCCWSFGLSSRRANKGFNPTMVRLLLLKGWKVIYFDVGFNPTMVRLLPCPSSLAALAALGFNPTMVRLLPQCSLLRARHRYCFNPTMVRLLQLSDPQVHWEMTMFQSHNGAIAAFVVEFRYASDVAVSIPQWCDCCRGLMLFLERH